MLRLRCSQLLVKDDDDMKDPNRLSATDAAALIERGELKSEDLVAACLARIEERETQVGAWAYVDRTQALAQARVRDREPARSRLHGLPIGVKDVLDTADMPTEYGSPIYREHRPRCDAACVALAREAGGVILGKTVSTEFATRHPGKTRNPHNLAHTPGGSSSGSAAAVADFMVPFAFGTQTSSSIIRPAAFCGTVGYKPSFGTINRAGMKFLSDSLDTIGVLTRSVADAALIVETLASMPPTSFTDLANLHPRIGFCRTPYWLQADAASRNALENSAARLGKAGARMSELELSAEFAGLAEAQIALSSFEFARALSFERCNFPELISRHLSARIEAGLQVTRTRYDDVQALSVRCRAELDAVFAEFDVLVAPSATGEAPPGLEATGDPVFGLMWTLLHVPCITLPLCQGPNGLPLGIQVVGKRDADSLTLRCAEWIQRALE